MSWLKLGLDKTEVRMVGWGKQLEKMVEVILASLIGGVLLLFINGVCSLGVTLDP